MGTAADEITWAYAAEIEKSHPEPDGSLMVYGVATSSRTDLDGQQCDPTWLKKAMPDWFASAANIREQHGMVAAGVGRELTEADDGRWYLKAHIVDPTTVAKVRAGVLKGFSVGIRNGKVQRGKSLAAPGGVIVDGTITEVSLVDRACNPDGDGVRICKSADGGGFEFVEAPRDDEPESPEEVDTRPPAPTLPDDHDPSVMDDFEGDEDDVLKAYGADDDPGDILKALDGDADDAPVTITKGLLEALVHGMGKPKKRDQHGRFSHTNTLSAQRRALRRKHEMERAAARDHRRRSDAEHLQDAESARRAGRQQEAGEHRARLGHYDKAAQTAEQDELLTSGLSVADWRNGMDLLRAIQAGDLSVDTLDVASITKAERAVYDEDDDIDRAKEIIAQLAELIVSEAEELAAGRFEEIDDIMQLAELVRGMMRFCRSEQRQGGLSDGYGIEADMLVHKAAGSDGALALWDDEGEPESTPLDEPTTPAATVEVTEQIEKAVSSATEALRVTLASVTAQLDEIRRQPIPGGPIANPAILKALSATPSTPSSAPQPGRKTEAEWMALASRPDISAELRAGYLANAEAAKG